MSLTLSTYKMNEKSKEKGFQSLSCSMPCWQIDEKKSAYKCKYPETFMARRRN
jgi:hypothetical protein